MTKQEQDKLWAELSEEKQHSAREMYKQISRHLDPDKSNAQNEAAIMSFALETTYGTHNLKPTLTYEDVAKELFKNNRFGLNINPKTTNIDDISTTSLRQAEKLLAINKLLNVAKFLNKNEDGSDWVPDWNESDAKWYLCIYKNRITINHTTFLNHSIIHFRTEALARQAIEILGEEVIRTALTTEY